MSPNTAKPPVAIVMITIVALVVTPIVVYWMIQFKRMAHLLMIKKRYSRILASIGVFTVVWFLIGFPVMMFDFAFFPWAKGTPNHEVIDRIALVLVPCGGMPIFSLIAWRFWLMYYDLMKSFTSHETDQWKIHLDPMMKKEHTSDESLFWLKHLKTYGSKQWTKKIVIVWNVVSVSVIIVLYQYLTDTDYVFIAHYCSVLLHSIPMVFSMILAYKVPHFADHFFVKYEMKLNLYFLVILVVFGAVAIMCSLIFASEWFMILVTIMGPCTFCIVDFISFYWIPKKVCNEEIKLKAFQENVAAVDKKKEEEKEEKEKEKEDLEPKKNVANESDLGGRRASIRRGSVTGSEIVLPTQNDVDEFVRRMSDAGNIRRLSEADNKIKPFVGAKDKTGVTANTRRSSMVPMMSSLGEEEEKEQTVDIEMDLPGILHDDAAFAIFMSHLAKDFSTDYLLCFIEIMQYKFLMKQRFDIIDPNTIGTDINFDIEYPLHGIAPLSEICKEEFVFDLSKYKANDEPGQLMKECKMVCFKIFKKYIETGAELKIKILESTKKHLVGLMKKESFWIDVNITPGELFRLYDETMGEVISVLNAFPAFQTACKALDNEKQKQ